MKAHRTLSKDLIIGKVTKLALALVLLAFVFLSLYPFVYMLIMSFMEEGKTMRLSWDYIKDAAWSFKNYIKIFKYNNFLRYFMNSLIVAVLACVGTAILSSLAAYAFAKKKFAGKNILYMLFLATMMLPGVVLMVPRYLQMKDMGLLNTHLCMAIPLISSAFGTILLRSFMKNVPDELLEAAELDGCSEFRKFITIVLPLIKPALISLTIFTAVSAWSEYLWPLLTASNPDMNLLTTAIAKMKDDNEAVNYGFVMAGATVSFLPPIIVYCFLQKQFVEGIALSGVKS